MKFSFNTRKLKYGTAGAAFIALFIAVLIVVNILAQFLTDRFSLKIDMTESGQYSLTAETKELLSALESDVNIYILSTRADMERSVSKNTLETIQRYNSESGGKVKYEFVDPNKNPAFFEKYPKAKNSQARALVVEGPKRYMVVESAEFAYTYSEDSTGDIYYQSEEKLSGAILYVSSDEVTGAGFVTGHGERKPDALENIFKGNNYDTQDVDLLSGVPAEITNLVISAPTADFTSQEIDALDKYMKVGGNNLYVFWSIDTPSCPVLERYLAEWGIEFEPYVVCDSSKAYLSEICIIPSLSENEIVDAQTQGQLMTLSPNTRPINVTFTEKGYMRTVNILSSEKSSYAKLLSSDKKISSLAKEDGDVPGPFTVGMVTEKADSAMLSSGDGSKNSITRVFAFGSYQLATSDIAGVSRAFNSKLLTQTVDYANPNTLTMNIKPKVTKSHDLNITESSVKLLFVLLIIIIPAAIIAAGIVVFIRRRNR